MPFTPTHIAAVLPFCIAFPRWLPVSALVIGSQIPDLPLYTYRVMPLNYRLLHTPDGLLVGCLPLGLLGFLWFQGWAKRPLVEVAPAYLRERLLPFADALFVPRLSFLFGVLAAIALGAASHVVWDAFTHRGSWGPRTFPVLNESVELAGLRLPVYKLLQIGSTCLLLPPMLLGLSAWLWRQPRQAARPTLSAAGQRFWLATLLLGPLLAAVAWATAYTLVTSATLRAFAFEGITSLGLFQFLTVNLFAAVYWLGGHRVD